MQRSVLQSVAAPTKSLSHVSPARSAKRIGLRYVHADEPGIARKKRGAGFVYLDARGRVVRDARTLTRIRSLVIPPAWVDVWICAHADGHLQATGRDARGRKQYRYHPSFREVRDEAKYEKMLDFAKALPKIRARCEQDLAQPGLARNKVLAAVVQLLEQTYIRIGNEEYTRLNKSFGLTTLRDQHAKIRGGRVQFRFRGKSGKNRDVTICDKRLARIVKRCQDLPGEILFQYVDEAGNIGSIGSSDVNDYLHEVAGAHFTAKDFRTWNGTLLAALCLSERGRATSQRAAKRVLVEAVKEASERLGNTPTICRKCYIHPVVMESYLRGHVLPRLTVAKGQTSRTTLRPEEKALVAFLKRASTTLTDNAARNPRARR